MQTTIEPGIFLPDLELWLDSRRVKSEGFISHAHSDHLASHHHVLATAETIALAAQRMKIKQAQALRYGEPLERDNYTLTLFPAGHCLGSAQVAIDVHATGERIVYTGDLHLGDDLFGQPAAPTPVRHAHHRRYFWAAGLCVSTSCKRDRSGLRVGEANIT